MSNGLPPPVKLGQNTKKSITRTRSAASKTTCVGSVTRGTNQELYSRFFADVRSMRRGAWRAEFTTQAINRYFREGFGMRHLPLDELPVVECGPFEPRFSIDSR